jgi:hypothetical protein
VSKLTIKGKAFRPLKRNTLCGFATITITELKLTIRDVAVHEKNGKRWAQLPAKPQIKEGMLIKDTTTNKILYATILEFDCRAVADAFSAAVFGAVVEHSPNAFAEGAET